MYISSYNRSKINVLSFVLIIMVVYIHSYYLELEKSQFAFVQIMIGNFCRVANPLFFFISGLLFFNGIRSIEDCYPKILRRVKSLLLPYIIWNIIFVLWYVLLSIVPGISGFVNSHILEHFNGSIWDSFYFLFLKPASFPLWFLRDLICLDFFSPFIFLALRYTRLWCLFFLILVTPFIHCIFTGVHIFFFIGGHISMYYSLEKLDSLINISIYFSSALFYFVLVVLTTLQKTVILKYIGILLYIGAIVFVWKTYDYLAKGRNISDIKIWKFFLGYSFFIYPKLRNNIKNITQNKKPNT